MDSRFKDNSQDSLVITGLGAYVLDTVGGDSYARHLSVDVLPWLNSRKTLKFMGKQDQLAVISAGRAIEDAGLAGEKDLLSCRTGLYLAVGYIPFERGDIQLLAEASTINGHTFSMERFGTIALSRVSPLLTFRCLPNMPAFHISVNFQLQGRYFVTYPGPGQFYLALEQAGFDLVAERVDVALVGGVADQENFLVKHHLQRLNGICTQTLLDVAGFFCLERKEFATKRDARIRAHLYSQSMRYTADNLLHNLLPHKEALKLNADDVSIGRFGFAGCAALPYYLTTLLSEQCRGELHHEVRSFDGLAASSQWRLFT